MTTTNATKTTPATTRSALLIQVERIIGVSDVFAESFTSDGRWSARITTSTLYHEELSQLIKFADGISAWIKIVPVEWYDDVSAKRLGLEISIAQRVK